MSYNKPIRRIAIVGAGVIGASWAAEYLARGFDVVVTDPAPNAEANLRKYVDEAWKDLTKWCVGVTVDPDRGQIYWTQKGPDNAGKGRIFRAKIDIPNGETAANRTDIELLFDGLPEPIDLELDLKNRFVYWTDRGDPPLGNTVNRA